MQQQSTRDHRPPTSGSGIISKHLPFLTSKFKKDIKVIIDMLNNNPRIIIGNQKYEHADIDQIFSHPDVSFIRTTHLWLHWNKYKLAIVKLQGRPFPNLKVLNVGGNSIESIEMLQKCDLSGLEELWLWNNNIVHPSSIKKCSFPNLKSLDVSGNNINEWQHLSQLQAPKLQLINIETNAFTSLRDMVKTVVRSHGFSLIFTENKMVTIFNQPINKGKKTISEATFNIKGKRFLKYE